MVSSAQIIVWKKDPTRALSYPRVRNFIFLGNQMEMEENIGEILGTPNPHHSAEQNFFLFPLFWLLWEQMELCSQEYGE